MVIPFSRCSAVILAGGKSRRMGTCKALLPWGGVPMIRHIHDQLPPFEEILISSNDPVLAETVRRPCVQDIYPDAGPLGGLHAARHH